MEKIRELVLTLSQEPVWNRMEEHLVDVPFLLCQDETVKALQVAPLEPVQGYTEKQIVDAPVHHLREDRTTNKVAQFMPRKPMLNYTTKQIVYVPAHQLHEESIITVAQVFATDPVEENTVEQIVNVLVLQIQFFDVITVVSQERTSERIFEQRIDVPCWDIPQQFLSERKFAQLIVVPPLLYQLQEDFFEATKTIPDEIESDRIFAETVDVPVPIHQRQEVLVCVSACF